MVTVGSGVALGGAKSEGVAPPVTIVMPKAEELEWVTFKNQLESAHFQNESLLWRRCKENPFVPIGCFLTTGVLTYGVYCCSKGNSRMSQKMMRLRIVAQGCTLFAIIAGVALGTSK